MNNKTEINHQFLKDVIYGLSLPLKKLSSKYFYDKKGDELFQKIMHLEEYYLPNSELEIIQSKSLQLIKGFDYDMFSVVELGAGDGSKTIYFLSELVKAGKQFTYCPLDISPDVLEKNVGLIQSKLPTLMIKPIPGDYFETLSSIDIKVPKILMFMGSNIGNFDDQTAKQFLKKIKSNMQPGDRLIMGMDLKKHPGTILKAYNDASGVTKEFNINLLKRINRELGADFDVSSFDHYPSYNPISGITYSFLVSLKKQIVTIAGKQFLFKEGEVVHTEVSQKYDLDQIMDLGLSSGFEKIEHFMDEREYFTISIFE